MSSILLMGPPGSGKTTMAALTAVKKPVYFVDFDRKVSSMANLQTAIAAGDLLYDEIAETLVEEPMTVRIKRVANNEKPQRAPQGWLKFAELCEKIEKNEKFLKAGTVCVDSLTRAAAHLERLILFYDEQGHATFSQREWGYFKNLWQETITILIDMAKRHDKDLICTVHERISEIPTESTRVIYDAARNRTVVGSMDMKIAASIQGSFGIEIGSYFEEVYGLSVKVNGGKAAWVCRVIPDGKRDLRTSHAVVNAEYPCDFREIWKGGGPPAAPPAPTKK